MLSQEDNRRLSEIEEHLFLTDPAFVARMRAARGNRPGIGALAGIAVMWAVVPIIGVAGGLVPALIAGLAFVAGTALVLRRPFRRARTA